jgi:hypothetical protein
MAAAAHDSGFARKAGIDQEVAQEFNNADRRKKALANIRKRRARARNF